MGREINFKNCVIMMTGNIGSEIAKGKSSVGFSAAYQTESASDIKDKIQKEALKKLSPEFLNRLDELIVFRNFEDDNLINIINLNIAELKEKLKARKISLFVNKAAKTAILSQVSDLKDGARPIERIIQTSIINPLSQELLLNSGIEIKKVKVGFSSSNFTFDIQ